MRRPSAGPASADPDGVGGGVAALARTPGFQGPDAHAGIAGPALIAWRRQRPTAGATHSLASRAGTISAPRRGRLRRSATSCSSAADGRRARFSWESGTLPDDHGFRGGPCPEVRPRRPGPSGFRTQPGAGPCTGSASSPGPPPQGRTWPEPSLGPVQDSGRRPDPGRRPTSCPPSTARAGAGVSAGAGWRSDTVRRLSAWRR